MRFSGRFADSLLTEQLDRVSLSFLVEDLQIRRGGIAPNICFGLAALGLDPLLVGSVGEDFGDYRAWLERHGVQTWPVRVSETQHTARFICTTDSVNAQIGSFYTGAMAEARQIELQPIAERAGGLDLVVIAPNDPEAMLRHTEECRSREFNFVADPSQQMAWLDGIADQTADRQGNVPVHQRLRGRPDHPEDRLVARGNRGAGQCPRDHPGHQGVDGRDRG